MERFFNRDRSRFAWLFTLLLLILTGCGSTQFSPEGRELMPPLQTALSAKKTEWLDATEKKIIARHDEKAISDTEFDAFNKIIKQARAGEWKEAQRATTALIDLQRPSSADKAQGSAKRRDRDKDEHRNPNAKK